MSLKNKQIVAKILVGVFILYYANICFFYHSHIINGTTIVHSHFHTKAHTQTGTHSQSEITLISALSAFQSFQAHSYFADLGIFFFLLATILPLFEKRATQNISACVSLRGPPSLS